MNWNCLICLLVVFLQLQWSTTGGFLSRPGTRTVPPPSETPVTDTVTATQCFSTECTNVVYIIHIVYNKDIYFCYKFMCFLLFLYYIHVSGILKYISNNCSLNFSLYTWLLVFIYPHKFKTTINKCMQFTQQRLYKINHVYIGHFAFWYRLANQI